MFKQKKNYERSDSPWSDGHYWIRWGYHRAIHTTSERRASVAFDQLKREERLNIKGRSRKRYPDLPNSWDDLNIGRSGNKSWKDVSRKRWQWE